MLKISRGLLEGFNFSLSVRKSNYCIQLQAVLIELKVWFNLVQMANYSSIYPWTTCIHEVLYFCMFLKVYSENVILKGSFCVPGPLTKFQYMVKVPEKTMYIRFCTPCLTLFTKCVCWSGRYTHIVKDAWRFFIKWKKSLEFIYWYLLKGF